MMLTLISSKKSERMNIKSIKSGFQVHQQAVATRSNGINCRVMSLIHSMLALNDFSG
jgi:hypothetical protein